MQELNQMRVKALIGTTVGIIFIIIGFILFIPMTPVGLTLFIGGAIINMIVNSTLTKTFKETYKTMICKEVLEKMFTIHEYSPLQGFSREYVEATGFIPCGNKYSSDDFIRGNYQGIEFERSDVTMQDVRRTGKTTTTVTLFEGSWTVFTFPKEVSSYLLIREKEFLSNGRPGGLFSNAPSTEKVTFEDIDFNERFSVFAQDEHDAFYVCTPHFIEKIKHLESKFDGRLTIGIMNNKVHVLFDDRKNRMEPSLLNEVTEEDYRNIKNEMYSLIDIIETLNLL